LEYQAANADRQVGGTTLRRSGYLVLLAVALAALLTPAESLSRRPQPAAQPRLSILTTAHDVHSLTVEQAAQGRPVRLRVVVTYYDPNKDPRRPACFASDSTGGIYIELRYLPAVPFKAGDLVEITGVSAAGGYAPVVIARQARVLGKSGYPAVAARTTLSELLTGIHDGQWVEVEGMVHAVRKAPNTVSLDLALDDGPIVASTTNQPGVDYDSLIDTRVKVRGNTAPLFNRRGQMTGVYLVFPGRAQVTVEEPAPPQPFALPASPVSGLLRFHANRPSRHRVHIRGTVTLVWPGRLLCLQDGTDNLCAQTDQTSSLSPGDLVDVIGFPTIGPFTPTLAQATYAAAGHRQPVPAAAVTAEQALSGDHDAQLVEIEGQFIGQDDFATDPNIVLSSGRYVFSAVLPAQEGGSGLSTLKNGSTLSLRGICSVKAGGSRRGFPIPQSFQILLRSPLDVRVIKRPSWWTPAHAVITLGAAVMLTLLVLAWVLILRKQVREQTSTIRQQLSEQERNSAALARQATELLRTQHALEAQTREIRKLNEDLEERIGERTAQLKAANRELEAFSYSVSHDLRAPLRHIAGFSSLLATDFGPIMSVEAREYLQIIEKSVCRMGQLIDALLSLARLGQQSLTLVPTELNPMLKDLVSVLQLDCEGRDVEWRIAQLPPVECDPVLMGQVFQNLLGNALKYSRGRAHAVIEVDSIQQPDKPAVFYVRDNGAGFDMKYATKLFGVFQRMHTESEFEGNGVGLATVQRIIQKHGGAIWAEAEANRGATFYFTLQRMDR
jgi:signal transduction histidine kinase